MSIQDYAFGLLVDEPNSTPKKKCSCKKVAIGILIALIAIIVILAIAFCIVFFVVNGGKHLQFSDIFDSSFTAFTVDSKWKDTNHFYWLNEDGNIELTDFNSTQIVLNFTQEFPNHTLETYLSGPTLDNDHSTNLLLVAIDPVKIWRHSRRSTYLIYNPTTHHTLQIGNSQSVLYGIWSSSIKVSGINHIYRIAYVENNNVYVSTVSHDTQTGTLTMVDTSALTTDGSDAIINGVNGWLYEEEVIHGATTLWWSPSGRYLAWLRTDESEVQTYNFPWYTPESPYPQDKLVRYTKPGGVNPVADLLIYDFESGDTVTVERPTTEEFYITTVSWLNEAEGLTFKWLNRLQNIEHIAICNPSNGNVTDYFKQVETNGWIPTTQIYPLKGTTQFVTVKTDNGYPQIFVYNSKISAQNISITHERYPVTDILGYNSEDQLIYYQAAPTAITRHIYAASMSGASPTCITCNFGGDWWSASCPSTDSADCKYMVLTNGGPRVPTHSLYKVEKVTVMGEETVVATHIKTLADNKKLQKKLNEYKLPKIEYTTFKDDSKTYDLNAYIIRPPKITFNRPVLFTVYGGPGSQQVSKAWYKDMFHMYLASQGYHIICVDGRGTGYRSDAFMKVIYKRMGVLEMLDQVAAGKQVSKHVSMHGKVAIWGWSFGGYMTSMVMSNASKNGPFSAGIAVAPPTDWRYYDSAYTERYMQRPEDNEAGYVETSVIPRAKNIKDDSFLLIHGTADDNVHFMNSALLNDELVDANVRFRTMYYVNRDHSIRVGNSLPHLYRNIIDFLDQRLK